MVKKSNITPIHYDLPITPLEFIVKNDLNFIEGNIIKYVCRYKQKNGVEDLQKAKEYLNKLIELCEK